MASIFTDSFFDNFIDYPGWNISENPLPLGTLYDYISSTFLDGFINYVNIKKAYLIQRYRSPGDIIPLEQLQPYRQSNSVVLPDRDLTVEEVFELYTQKDINIHTKISTFRDDVVILSQALSNPKCWIYFYYDMDCSDCSIGRFETDEPEEVVIVKLEQHLESFNNTKGPFKEIPLHFFKGWISS
ncbi:MAG: hypothetical protein M0R77_00315 [Gammaproteobacteria bacterium]|nr:hypothetical protein [Gammaproteobacteria bacterium]